MDQTYTEEQTADIAEQVLSVLTSSDEGATVLALQGDLGAGKTTLTKVLAEKLGVTDTVVSPTFVIAKFYHTLRQAQGKPHGFEQVVHIDAYRIESNDELAPLGWQTLLQQPNTLVIVEWPERIHEAIPSAAHRFLISHDGNKRTIKTIV